MKLSLIVAMTEKGVIGKDNRLPWHLPADLHYFKRATMGHPIIMGRRTFESIGKALPGRRNIVVSRQESLKYQGCEVVHSLQEALMLVGEVSEAFVIGGRQLFEAALPQVQRLLITWVHADIEGDVTFPDWNPSEWQEISRENHQADQDNPYDYSFVILERA